MSISFRQIRKNSTAQGRFKDLVQAFQRAQSEQTKVDNPDFAVRSRTMHSKLVYQDPFFTHKVKPISTVFYLPFEPDGKYCVGMWSMNHNGRFCVDASGAGHHGRWLRNPMVKEGIDLGFGTSLYADFDGRHIAVYIDDRPGLRLSLAPFFSITCRIYPRSIEATDGVGGTRYRTILHKADTSDSTGQHTGQIDSGTVGNGYTMAVTPDGKVRFSLISGGIRYTVETLPDVIVASDPPTAYEITVTCNQLDKRTIPQENIVDPADIPGADPEAFPDYPTPLIAPRMEISVNNQFYALYTTEHLPFTDDGPFRRLRFGTNYPFLSTDPVIGVWYKWLGGIQQIRFYNGRILTFPEIQNLNENKLTIREMRFGSPALAGSTIIFDPSWAVGYDIEGYDPEGFDTAGGAAEGYPAFDPVAYDPGGYDTLNITLQGTIQNGGYNPRGFSSQGYHTLPFSQS